MAKDKIVLIFIFLSFCSCSFSQKLRLEIGQKDAVFLEGKDSVLVYQKGPKSLNGTYKRANYIHPLFSLNGNPITEDFPSDHLHHRGIFWAWHQLYIDGKRIGDGWEIKNFEWNDIRSQKAQKDDSSITLESRVHWESSLKTDSKGDKTPLIVETNWITVYPKKFECRVIDVKIQLENLYDNTTLGGSEDEKGYGGFSARVYLSEDVLFKDSEKIIIPENEPVQGKNWINICSKTQNEEPFGLAIIPFKDNPSYPNPWILRAKASMQNAVYPFPGATPILLKRGAPLILEYRLVIHDGTLKNSTLTKIQHAYFNSKE